MILKSISNATWYWWWSLFVYFTSRRRIVTFYGRTQGRKSVLYRGWWKKFFSLYFFKIFQNFSTFDTSKSRRSKPILILESYIRDQITRWYGGIDSGAYLLCLWACVIINNFVEEVFSVLNLHCLYLVTLSQYYR